MYCPFGDRNIHPLDTDISQNLFHEKILIQMKRISLNGRSRLVLRFRELAIDQFPILEIFYLKAPDQG